MRRTLWTLAVLGLLILAYCRFFPGTSFTQDDFVWLCFCKFYPTPADILWRDTLCGQFFRPMGQFWWLAMHSLAGDTLLPYQLAFLGLHLLNAVLAAQLSRRIISPDVGRVVFLLFALNPLFLAPISNYYCYVFDILGACFFLTALLLLRHCLESKSRRAGLLSLAVGLLAYLSKEAFFTLPALAILVAGIDRAGERWKFATLRHHSRWIVLHTAVWCGALLWRTVVIGRVGGYGLVAISQWSDLIIHALDRTHTFLGFAGWSLLPHLSRWVGDEILPLILSVLLLGVLSWAHQRTRQGPGVIWIWAWMFLAWAPSLLMITYAAVSWYACLLGSLLLLAVPLSQTRWAHGISLVIALDFALCGLFLYGERQPYITELRNQQATLQATFPRGGWSRPPGERIFLLHSCPDLFPDAIVKYGTPHGQRMADVLFLNHKTPVDWVITNPEGPGDIDPMYVDPTYQTGWMDMHRYRAYPLAYEGRRLEILRRGAPFRFLAWEYGQLIDVTDHNPMNSGRPHNALGPNPKRSRPSQSH